VAVRQSLVNSHCHRCIRRVPSDIRPVKCDTCSFTLYCSRECKSRDTASHAIICDALKGLSGELSPSINYLPWEILWGHLEVLGAGWADDGELSDLIDMSGASSETSLPWGYKPDEIIDKETLRLVCAIHAKYWADHWAFLLFLVGKGKLCLWFTADRSLKSEHHRLRNRPVVSCTHGPCRRAGFGTVSFLLAIATLPSLNGCGSGVSHGHRTCTTRQRTVQGRM
jgi:hypothetical protein